MSTFRSNHPSRTHRRGRRRRARSMGRPPEHIFSHRVETYIAEVRTNPEVTGKARGKSPITIEQKKRDLLYLARLFEAWKDEGVIKSADPATFDRATILVLENYLNSQRK